MKDYYAIMALPRNATAKQIRAKWLFLAKDLHPDTNAHPGAGRALAEVNEAYATLKDPAKRRAYDLQSKVREFVPRPSGGTIDLILWCRKAASGRMPDEVIDQGAQVLKRALGDRGIDAEATTAEDLLQAIGWLKPKRRKRA